MFCFCPGLTPFRYLLHFDTFSALRAQKHSIHYSLPPLLLRLTQTKLTGKGILLFKTQASASCQVPVSGFRISLAARVDRCYIPDAAVNFCGGGKTEADYGLET